MNSICEMVCSNEYACCIYFALLFVLVLMILWNMRQPGAEGYRGGGYGGDKVETKLSAQSQEAQALSAGANLRRLAQEFSQPNQGDYGIAHKKDMLGLVPEGERLVSLRGEPDFWEIGNVLAAYRGQHETGAIKDQAERAAVEAAKKEYLAPGPAVQAVRDAELGLSALSLYH